MKPKEMVSTLERIPSEPIDVETGAPDDENPPAAAGKINQAFQIIAPGAISMDFVENHSPARREFATEDPFSVFGDIPIEIIVFAGDDLTGYGGLSDLPRSGNENQGIRNCFSAAQAE